MQMTQKLQTHKKHNMTFGAICRVSQHRKYRTLNGRPYRDLTDDTFQGIIKTYFQVLLRPSSVLIEDQRRS